MNRSVILVAAIGLAILAGYLFLQREPKTTGSGAALADVTVPQLSGASARGETAFDANCSSCHGQNAAGRDGFGPPLVHKIYEPSHHGDMAFVLAAKQGVRQHHWDFGNMPPVAGVTDAEVADIIAYVRTLQRANGIE